MHGKENVYVDKDMGLRYRAHRIVLSDVGLSIAKSRLASSWCEDTIPVKRTASEGTVIQDVGVFGRVTNENEAKIGQG